MTPPNFQPIFYLPSPQMSEGQKIPQGWLPCGDESIKCLLESHNNPCSLLQRLPLGVKA